MLVTLWKVVTFFQLTVLHLLVSSLNDRAERGSHIRYDDIGLLSSVSKFSTDAKSFAWCVQIGAVVAVRVDYSQYLLDLVSVRSESSLMLTVLNDIIFGTQINICV